ncbi:pentatricopeptide repeat-containing protein [Tanacetum coccineum]|uniref:Pentatricopeptide repeat-containing protein n=1 Tax=Tanacetum coccineum TaxID=301880 RepID=A0ABQ5AYK2_9ASTR
MQDRNVMSWTSMLTGYLLRGLYDESLKLHLQMQVDGVKPNPFTFATILGALADSGVVVKGSSCLSELAEVYHEIQSFLQMLKKYNKDVKYGYANPSPSYADVEYLQFYEEGLRHRDQMRRWEMYVNGRPLRSKRDRLE